MKTTLTTEQDTLDLGARLAGAAEQGDIIALSGPLGAGKTVLARGFIRARLGASIDVASPTFTLVHVYDQTDPAVWHFDFFRLEESDECQELGLDEALASGISLVEWPDKAGGYLPPDRLNVALSPAGDSRHVTLDGGPSWTDRISRLVPNHG